MKKYPQILILEDDTTLSFIYKHVFKKINPSIKLVFCTNGHEGISFIEKQLENGKKLPDYILSDLHMPLVDGWQFLDLFQKLLVKKGFVNRPKVWICSSDVRPEVIAKSNQHPIVDRFVEKTHIFKLLDELINTKQLQFV